MNLEDLDIKEVIRQEPPKTAATDITVGDLDVLKLKLRLAEIKKAAEKQQKLHANDASLRAVIDLCLNTGTKVENELRKLSDAMQKLLSRIADPKVKVRYDYLDYQGWFIVEHTTRARNEAGRRKRLLDSLDTPEKIEAERKKCEASIEYWFDNYAWILDPRNNVLYAFPFQLFGFQRESLHWIDELIYVEKNDGLIDKSRDMGVTWLIICMFVYYWLFPKNDTQFHALITSYREDEVDKRNVPSTIFEKIRSQIRLLPSWMLPKGFNPKEHLTHMTVINPENGSSIIGTTANAETGRSGRFTAIFFDEMASIKDDVSSATAATASTNTRLFVSTPKGKLNYFAEMRFDGDIPVRSFHWKRHPLKDVRWYNGQKLKMTVEMIAQELDIDYDASQPGKVYPMYSEVYHVITKSDFMREVLGGTVVNEDGSRRMRVPVEWWLGRSHDWGSSDSGGEHANLTYWFARAKEGTRTKTYGIDIGGAVFVYRELLMPPHSTVRAVAKKVHQLQGPDKEQDRMQTEIMSHEALSERDTYEQEHGLYYKAWDTDYNGGIAQVRDYLEVQHTFEPHPFRLPVETPSGEKQILKGRPMLYFVVDDDQGEFYFDADSGKFQVRPGKDSGGLDRIRREMGVYHYPKSEAGKAVRKQRPEKMFDDAMDCLRCMASTFPPVAEFSDFEKLEAMMPAGIRVTDAAVASPKEKAAIWIARQMKINEEKLLERLKPQRGITRGKYIMAKAREDAARSKGRDRL